MLVVCYLKICDGNVHLKAIFIKITHFTNHKALVINDMCQWRIQGGAPPQRPKIFSISYSFWENLTKSYVGAPPRGSAPPPTGNPVSAPVSAN